MAGTEGDDYIVTNCKYIFGQGGNDVIWVTSHLSRAGVYGGAGSDRICARNDSGDHIDGGDGRDFVDADSTDGVISATRYPNCAPLR